MTIVAIHFLWFNIQPLKILGIVCGVNISVYNPIAHHAVNVTTGHMVQDFFLVGEICRTAAAQALKIVAAVRQYSGHNSDL